MTEWQVVRKRVRVLTQPTQRKSRDEISKLVLMVVQEWIPSGIRLLAIYGSVGRNTHTKHSDVDIVVIVNNKHPFNEWAELASCLKQRLGLSVDLIMLQFADKAVDHTDVDFYENVLTDAHCLIGNSPSDVFFSVLRGKWIRGVSK